METKSSADPDGCPGRAQILEILASELTGDPDSKLVRHLDSCPRCQAVMDELMGPASLDRLASVDAETMPDYQGGRETGSGQVSEIPGYRILETVGHGGEGVVYKAIDTKSGETVALKRLAFVPFSEFGNEGREIEAARKLDHPGIVKLLHQFEWNGHTVLAMRWVEGGTLKDYLERHTLTPEEAVRLAVRLCDILEYAHGQGLIHRDLKPANVLLENGDLDNPRLADFGLAKFAGPEGKYSAVTSGLGTPGYMPPEMVSTHFGPVGPATDIYSLGAILHETLVRRLPFESDTPFDMLRRTCDEPVTSLRRWRPEVPVDLETVCLKCLAKRPHERYHEVGELKADLIRYRKGEPVLARRAGSVDQLRDWARRHPAVALSLSATFLILVTSVAVLSILLERSRESRLAAERSLKLAVDSMKNAAPIYKRFVQNAIPSKDERRNLESTARLSLQIGDDTPDLRLRCDSYFNALQMGTAIREFPEQLDLAESIFRQTLEKYRNLKAKHETALRKSLRIGSFETEYVSELDMVNIRIAYCLIEIATVNYRRGPDHQQFFATFLDQAIDQCEITLKENRTLEEAWSQLGNFLKMKSDRLDRDGKSEEALAVSKSTIDYQKSFYLLKSEDTLRWMYYIDSWMAYLRRLESNRPGTMDFRNAVHDRLEEIRNLYRKRPENWSAMIASSLGLIGHFIVYEKRHYEPDATISVCDELLDILGKVRERAGRDVNQLRVVSTLWTEIIAQFVLSGQVDRARAESFELEKWLVGLNRSLETDAMLCSFRLISPLPDFRSTSEAIKLAADIPKDEPSTKLLTEWVAIASGGPIPPDLDNSTVPENPNESARWATCILFALERLGPGAWTDADRNLLAKAARVLDNDLIHSTSWGLRCRELQAASKAAANAAEKNRCTVE